MSSPVTTEPVITVASIAATGAAILAGRRVRRRPDRRPDQRRPGRPGAPVVIAARKFVTPTGGAHRL